MRARKSKPAPKLKSREELLADLRGNEEFQRKMAFTRDRFWPALVAATTSVNDATDLLYGFSTNIMDAFLERMKEVKLSELNLRDRLKVDSDMLPQYEELLALFDDTSVFDAKDLIDGMRNEIELWKSDEFRGRTLDSLKVVWLDELE